MLCSKEELKMSMELQKTKMEHLQYTWHHQRLEFIVKSKYLLNTFRKEMHSIQGMTMN